MYSWMSRVIWADVQVQKLWPGLRNHAKQRSGCGHPWPVSTHINHPRGGSRLFWTITLRDGFSFPHRICRAPPSYKSVRYRCGDFWAEDSVPRWRCSVGKCHSYFVSLLQASGQCLGEDRVLGKWFCKMPNNLLGTARIGGVASDWKATQPKTNHKKLQRMFSWAVSRVGVWGFLLSGVLPCISRLKTFLFGAAKRGGGPREGGSYLGSSPEISRVYGFLSLPSHSHGIQETYLGQISFKGILRCRAQGQARTLVLVPRASCVRLRWEKSRVDQLLETPWKP